jgi:16S rRNA (cytidine1402-2'-O)-methyltransferase
MGTLYIVATPIGNLGDMTPRAVETLRQVDLIAAEDTRHSARLLRHFGIDTPVVSYFQHNQKRREAALLQALAKGDVALISDAGVPALSDPGQGLAAAARHAGHRIVPIPGASSLTSAVSASGLVEGPFVFLGFLPRTGDERAVTIARAAAPGFPLAIFEAANRLAETLDDLARALGDRPAVVARELTKVHEEIAGGTLTELRLRFQASVKGEVVIVVDGAAAQSLSEDTGVHALVRSLLASGMKPSRAAREAAAITGLPGSEVYEIVRQVSSDSDRS